MASRLSHRLLGILAFVMLTSFAVPSFAQGPDRETAQKVLMIVKNANDEFDRGEYDDALRLYQEAYDLYPNPVLLYRIGMAAEKTGDTRRAVEAYESYVAAAADGDATAEKLGEVIPELRGGLPPRVTVSTTPAGANVYVGSLDSEPLGVTPGTFELSENEVELIVRLEGYKVVRKQLQIDNGEDVSHAFELQELTRLATADPEETPTETSDSDSLNLAVWGWVATGVGVAVLGTGVALKVLSSSKATEANEYNKRAPGATRAELEELKDSATSLHQTSVPLLVGGGIVTGIGVSLLVVDMLTRDSGEVAQALRPGFAITRDGAWVGIGGRF